MVISEGGSEPADRVGTPGGPEPSMVVAAEAAASMLAAIDAAAAEAAAETNRRIGLPRLPEWRLPRAHPLYRPRHGGRQRAALVCALVFFLVPAVAFVGGVRPAQIENHRLVAFPSVTDGWRFFTGLGAWATDNLPLRDVGVRAESVISQGLFGEAPYYALPGQGSGTSPLDPAGSAPATESPRNSGDFPQVIQGTDGWLYYGADMKNKCQPLQPLSATIAALQQLRAAVEASGRRFVLVVAPDKSTVFPEHLPANYAGKACAEQAGQQFWNQVTSTAGALDLRAQLRNLATDYRLSVYYPQDTHWTDTGALAMLHTLAENLQPGVTRTWQYKPDRIVSGPTDLPPLIGLSATNQDLTYRLSPDGTTDRTGAGTTDLAQPHRWQNTPVTGMISGPVTVLGDSFLLPTTSYLPAVFSDVTALAYGDAMGDPNLVVSSMVSAHTVVLEAVERNLAAGAAPFLQPAFIQTVRTALASQPVR